MPAIAGLLLLFLIVASCIGSRPATQISDYSVLPGGLEIAGGNPLYAFVFENNTSESIEKSLNERLQTKQYSNRKFDVSINGENFNLWLYDNAEFEKHFSTYNFVVVNLEPVRNETVSPRKFIAISMTGPNGEDCLAPNSLYNRVATDYLKSFKDEYINEHD
ncbi:MAG TPA: hypothetical protein VF676_13495 [Flavobacterium sp.]|jgi:hypothetical protein